MSGIVISEDLTALGGRVGLTVQDLDTTARALLSEHGPDFNWESEVRRIIAIRQKEQG